MICCRHLVACLIVCCNCSASLVFTDMRVTLLYQGVLAYQNKHLASGLYFLSASGETGVHAVVLQSDEILLPYLCIIYTCAHTVTYKFWNADCFLHEACRPASTCFKSTPNNCFHFYQFCMPLVVLFHDTHCSWSSVAMLIFAYLHLKTQSVAVYGKIWCFF